eukprot:5355415-Prymnesium_polylepis.1
MASASQSRSKRGIARGSPSKAHRPTAAAPRTAAGSGRRRRRRAAGQSRPRGASSGQAGREGVGSSASCRAELWPLHRYPTSSKGKPTTALRRRTTGTDRANRL